MEPGEFVSILFFGILIGLLVMGIAIMITSEPIELSQETADDICINLTGNETAVATSNQGKLTCKLPSYDATQNIIIEKNNE